ARDRAPARDRRRHRPVRDPVRGHCCLTAIENGREESEEIPDSSAAPPFVAVQDEPSPVRAKRPEALPESTSITASRLANGARATDSVWPLPARAASACRDQPAPDVQRAQSSVSAWLSA